MRGELIRGKKQKRFEGGKERFAETCFFFKHTPQVNESTPTMFVVGTKLLEFNVGLLSFGKSVGVLLYFTDHEPAYEIGRNGVK